MDLAIIFDILVLQQKKLTFSIRIFPSFHTENYDQTKTKELEMVSFNGGNIDLENYNFEFRQGDYENFFKIRTSWSFNWGISLNYKRIITEIRYMNNLIAIGQAGQFLPIKYKIHSIHFLIGITF